MKTNEELILEPTPAVPGLEKKVQISNKQKSLHLLFPGRPVTEPKIVFNEFLDETTPVPTMINVDDVKTVDLAGFDKEEDDFPIYDTEFVPQPTPAPVSTPVLKNSEFPGLKDAMMSTGLTDADFADMPIFSNFPMMGPGEFIQVE